ncbi:hypothetical protein ACCI51_09900 [Microbulbifer echini]|uniref:LPS export ABC transporter periplasmic protein LptC n=1 Tax=Microbulbifer echini TaxID=1529067 RepID=A0ABV4NMU0_9GAMM
MKKLAFPVLILFLGAGYFFWIKSQPAQVEHSAKLPEPKMVVDRVPVESSSAETVDDSGIPEEVVADSEKSLWSESDLAREVLHENGRLPVDLNGETYLELDMERLRGLETGDYVDIDLPGLESVYDAQVGDVEQHASGNKSVQLNFLGQSRLHGATLTIGKSSVYAQLNTPAGSYTLEAQDGYAWIAPNGALISNHVEKHDKDLSSEAQREKDWKDSDVPLNDFE